MKKMTFCVGLLCILSGCICIITIFWQVNLIKTELKTVKQELEQKSESMESNISLTNDLEFQVRELKSAVFGGVIYSPGGYFDIVGVEGKVRELESRVDRLEIDLLLKCR